MKIKTKSFELAVSVHGDERSDKLALILPGRLDTKDYANMQGHTEYLANRGYFAVSFDPPGTWESEGSIELYSMTNYKKAIDELITYYGNRQTFLMGHSRGGSMAMLAGTRNARVVGFAAVMSYYSYVSSKRSDNDLEWESKGYKINKRDVPNMVGKYREFRLPYAFFLDQAKYDMTEDLRRWKKPKLFIYGERDETVKPEIVKRAYEIAVEPKEIASINSDHGYRESEKLVGKINDLVGKFLDKYEKAMF